ncbi:class I adenylate-forming enzyme family protein [Sedimentitalea nanhaiensis]|uniref:Fatty-acyl-CoA synthase n=1 Tax=Sedimentitalea nanhaiensis TaxID=999627 RepID=A0A1I7DFT9_9RHOB|nr:AMP-binding protein [Sedimentitalea nanhaiensis]SFU10534.1 fatty-acyl-CoA synthase [Sedimentitalea nanhaiensis]
MTAPSIPGISPQLALQSAGLTIGALFDISVRQSPRRIALEDAAGQMTYHELDIRSNRLANHLLSRGVQRGDRIAILSENRREYIEILIATAKIGVIAACQNWRLSEGELRHCLELVTPKLIFTSPRNHDLGAKHADICPLQEFGPNYETAISAESEIRPPDPCHPEDGVVILYTSGTTGLPKGALISHRAEIARTMGQMIDLPVTPEDAFVAWAPLFHMVSTDTVFSTLMQGGTVIVTDGFNPTELAEIVTSKQLGRLTLMPGMIEPFLSAMKVLDRPVIGVKWAGVMADLVPPKQISEVTTLLDAPYLNSFGSTETGLAPASGGLIPVGEVPQSLDKQQSSLCQIRLVDPDDNEVPDGEPGELVIRSPALFSGYWNNEQANTKDFRGGWFHMGDVFIRNPDHTLSFVDRRKYLIKSGGENIYPAEVERVLLSNPRVADAVVIRKPDAQWGEVPVAYIVRKDHSLSEDDLLAQCAGRIAKYKWPKEFRFVSDDELPRSTTGKIIRHELESRMLKEQSAE